MTPLQEAARSHTLYRVTTRFGACAGVFVKDGIITQTAPIFKTFRGQPLGNLERWGQVTHIERMDHAG